MGRNLGTTIRLTIESKMNNRKVIHNGMMGVYEDYTPVVSSDVKGLEKTIKELYTYLVKNTKHKVVIHTYGVEVQTGETLGSIGQSFIGYDESLDSKLRLCYCNDTFLAMELTGIMKDFIGNKPLTKVAKGLQQGEETNVSPTEEEPEEGTPEGLEANTDNTEEYQDYGWGEDGRDTILSMLYNRLDKLCARLENQPEVSAKNVKGFRAEVKKVIKENEGILTKGMPLTKGVPVYEMITDFLDQLSKVYPYLRVQQEKSNLLMETSNREKPLNVYDRELGKDRYKGEGNVMITVNTPVHKGFRKVLDFLSSNVSYARISGGNDPFTEEEDKKKQVKKQGKKQEQGKKEQGKKEEVKSVEQVNMEDQYFNIYLTKAGSWGKKDDEYEKLKVIIEGLIREKDIDGVTLRGLDDTEVFIDWVINNETYTMALTKKATEVNELEMKYDMVIAYDTEYPDIVGVLIEDKLNGVFDKLDK